MRYPILTPDICATLARDQFRVDSGYKNKTDAALDREICQSLIGTSYNVCSELWNKIDPQSKEDLVKAEPKHLFWALVFLKTYCTEAVLRRVVGGVDGGTLREWSWKFVRAISDLKPGVIKFENRFREWDGISVCTISVDGTDCAVKEPYPFSTNMYSEKLNGPGLKYEVGVCIATGEIVWVNGPFPAGTHDVTVFAEKGLRDALADDECIEVDNGYQGYNQLKNGKIHQCESDKRQKGIVRSRGENVNARLKQFEVLNGVFRHTRGLELKHRMCFFAVAVITELGFELDGGLHSVEYDVNYD